MLDEKRSLQWLHFSWHFSAIDSVTTLHTCAYHHHDTHTHTHTHRADIWFISCVCIKGKIAVPVHLQCWPQGGRNKKQCFWKEEIHCKITQSSWMWSWINGLSFPDISKECGMFINKNSMKDVPMLKHHYHTITHCVKIFLQSITTRNVIKIDTAFNNISDFLDFRSDIHMGGSMLPMGGSMLPMWGSMLPMNFAALMYVHHNTTSYLNISPSCISHT